MSEWFGHWNDCEVCGGYDWYMPGGVNLYVLISDGARPPRAIPIRSKSHIYLVQAVPKEVGEEDPIDLDHPRHPLNLLCDDGFRLIARWEIQAAVRYSAIRKYRGGS